MVYATSYNICKNVLQPSTSCDHAADVQEVQLRLRNRASAMHFFVAKLLSSAVMTYAYVYHLRILRPMIRLIC